MTISSETRKTSAFTSGTALPFTFKVFDSSEMLVVQQVLATGVETILTEITHYTVALNADQNSSPGGTVNLVTTIPATDQVVLSSSILFKQLTALTNQGGFYPNVNNDVFDKLTILIQQVKELTDRSVKFPFSDPSISSDLPAVAQRKGTVLAFNETTGEPEVGPDIASVDTVADNVADINTVAADIASVITTATDISSIITVATNIANVLIAAANDANITIVADDIASVIIAATNVADITNFSDVYQGPYTTAAEPTVRNDSSALQSGDLYFNTTIDEMKAYTGAAWVTGYSGTVNAGVLVGATLAANVLASSLTSVGVLNDGSISNGFGNIDIGASTFDTTGAINGYKTAVNVITSSANVTATNMALGNIHTLALAENTTFSAPINTTVGQRHTWIITKDATGTARTIAWNSVFDFDNGVEPESLLNTGARVIVEGVVQTSGIILCTVMGQSGWKQYTEAAGDISVTGTSWTTTSAVAVPYRTTDDVWRLKFNIRGTLTSDTNKTITFNGVTFAAIGTQAISISTESSGSSQQRGHVNPSASTMIAVFDAALVNISFSGDVVLASKPTWAD